MGFSSYTVVKILSDKILNDSYQDTEPFKDF